MDSVLSVKLARKEILNLHPSSRSYSWNIGDVHFVHGQRYAGDTSYCESNLEWLKADLEKYASKVIRWFISNITVPIPGQ